MYSTAIIYKLWSREGPETYIGGTIQSLHTKRLSARFEEDKKFLFKLYKKVEIELLFAYTECQTRQDLKDKIREYQYPELGPVVREILPPRVRVKRGELTPALIRQKDQNIYYKDVEASRRLKIIQKLPTRGALPSESSIIKYKITLSEIMTVINYLEGISDIMERDKLHTKLLKRINFINNMIKIPEESDFSPVEGPQSGLREPVEIL